MNKSAYLNKISVWDKNAACHILSRTLFGFDSSNIDFALSMSLDDFVDNYLLDDLPEPANPLYNGIDWTNQPNNLTNQTNYNSWFRSLSYWWMKLMMTQGYSLKERMTLFLHNHFVSEITTVKVPQFMFLQNKLFRQYAFGNFKELTKKVTIDPAMLVYLNGIQNTKNNPNENYARELLELFTIGIGNYTEADIQQAAKALTGWRIDNNSLTSFLNANLFDNSSKTFLGQSGNFGYTEIIDIIFSKNSTSEFLCRKLYKEFAYYEPNNDYVVQLAKVMRDNNYEMKPVLSMLLKSEYFHSVDIRGAKIKSPAEFLFSTFKQFNILNTSDDVLRHVKSYLDTLQQTLFNPPDVRGWPGQRDWISTITLPTRNAFTDQLVDGKKLSAATTLKIDLIAYARTYSSSEKADKFVEDVCAQLIQYPISETQKKLMIDTLLDGAAIYDWSTYTSQAESRLQKFFKALMRLPEFQLS